MLKVRLWPVIADYECCIGDNFCDRERQHCTESRPTEAGCGSVIFDGIYGIFLGNHRIIIAQKIETPTIKIIIFFFTAARSLSFCAGVGVWQNGQWLLSSSNVLPQ